MAGAEMSAQNQPSEAEQSLNKYRARAIEALPLNTVLMQQAVECGDGAHDRSSNVSKNYVAQKMFAIYAMVLVVFIPLAC